ncbi:MAG: peptidyl-prolyl cis-trans isomerase [Armatimonadota bacterium]
MKSTTSWKLCTFFALIVVALSIVTGCSKQPVAVVNGQKITEQDLSERLKENYGEQVLGDMIFRAMVDGAFEKAGLEITEEELNLAIEQDKQQAPNEEMWQQMLASRGMTPEEYREEKKFRMKVEKLTEDETDVTDEQLKEFFEENRSRFQQPEMVEISEIIVSSDDEAQKIYSQLQENADLFGDLARQHSLSPQSREQGGKRGNLPLDRLTPVALQSVVADMSVGDISSPEEISGNWYIIRLDGHTQAKQPTFDEVKDTVKQAYAMQNRKSQDELLDELRRESQVTIIDPEYQRLSEFFGPQEPESMPSFGTGEQAPEAGADQQAPDAAPDQQEKEAEKAYEEQPADSETQEGDTEGQNQ